MSYTNLGPGDEATWAPGTGHPNDPRTYLDDDEAIMRLDIGDAKVDVVYERTAFGESIVSGIYIGADFVDVSSFAHWQRTAWQNAIERKLEVLR